jgi:hypothetical protein
LYAAPTAFRVAEVVVVEGAVVVVVGLGVVVVVLAGVGDVPGGGLVVELDVGGDEVGEFRVVDAPGKEPSVRDADFVWKVSTPASPAIVAPMTIGVRLIELALFA